MINLITELVKESGITNIIIGYKDDLEYKDILDYHTYNWVIDWEEIVSHGDIDVGFIQTYFEYLDFEKLYETREDFIRNEDFLEAFKDKLDWNYITQEWSTNANDRHLVEKFKDYVEISWFVFADQDSYFTGETLEYIREFKDIMDWEKIFDYAFHDTEMPQEFSDEFYNYLTFVDMEYIMLY